MKALLLAGLCAAGLVAVAQTHPAPGTSRQYGPSRAGVTARSYTTRPHALRVTTPDTAGQKIKRATVPSAASGAGVVPLPKQRQVPR